MAKIDKPHVLIPGIEVKNCPIEMMTIELFTFYLLLVSQALVFRVINHQRDDSLSSESKAILSKTGKYQILSDWHKND